jgi:hypothetical protein
MPIIQQELRKFFASKGSGDLANTALQPDDIGTIVQAYDQALVAASPFSKDALALANGGAWRVALGIDPTYYSRANILGAVSQSDGVPTGAVIQSGSNANGSFVRYANGFQIFYARMSFVVGFSLPAGNLFRSGFTSVWNYPAAIATIQGSFVGATISDGAGENGSVFAIKANAGNASQLTFDLFSSASGTYTVSVAVSLLSRGF